MKIVADAGILAVEDCFRDIGELVLVSGRELRREQLLTADALLVRSITPVDAELLQGTTVGFVGTATSGTDHIDLDYLHSQKIKLAHTKGSNANAVVDYCFAALAWAEVNGRKSLGTSTVGLLGSGQVGSRFAERLQALGCDFYVCDPAIEACLRAGRPAPDAIWSPPLSRFVSLETLLQCDIISLHVPLTDTGDYPTHNLLNVQRLAQIGREALLINTCRGAVVNGSALRDKLRVCPGFACVMDVWVGEPDIDVDLVSRVDIATPHIAGYSENAKLTATLRLAEQLRRFLDLEGTVPERAVATIPVPHITDISEMSHWQLLLDLLPLPTLDAATKASAAQGALPSQFDQMRSALQSRHEYCDYRVEETGFTPQQLELLAAMGMRVDHAIR